MIEPIEVQSSAIRRVAYERNGSMLYVEFWLNQSVYVYEGVPEDLYLALLDTNSVGRYFQTKIRNCFKYSEFDNNDWAVAVRFGCSSAIEARQRAFVAKTRKWIEQIGEDGSAVGF